MIWTEYIKICDKTLAFTAKTYELDEKDAKVKSLSSRCDLVHMALGLTSEIDEIINVTDEVNLNEELGDFLWYVGCTTSIFKNKLIKTSSFDFKAHYNAKPERTLIENVSKFSDIAKKTLFYKRSIFDSKEGKNYTFDEIDDILYDLLINVANSIEASSESKIEDILDKNIHKLQNVRYKDGFSVDEANNRDLEKERKSLE